VELDGQNTGYVHRSRLQSKSIAIGAVLRINGVLLYRSAGDAIPTSQQVMFGKV
jgi:hypothetical protein